MRGRAAGRWKHVRIQVRSDSVSYRRGKKFPFSILSWAMEDNKRAEIAYYYTG